MSREFTIERDYYCMKDIIFKKNKFTIEPNLTVLVGCNGSGKTTMLNSIKYQLEKNNIKYTYFDNLHDGGSSAISAAGYHGDSNFMIEALVSSEGENIIMNLGKCVQKIGYNIRKNPDINEYWILLDAVDSGLSIDGVINLKDGLYFIIEQNVGKDIYIVVSANEYELAREENCFDVTNCEYIKFKDYDDYRNFIIESKKYKKKRYNIKD